MKPHIDATKFGSITIDGHSYDHDVVLRLDGTIEKRKKKLSKARYGSAHTVSPEEAKHIYDKGADRLIVGTGQHGVLEFSQEARDYLSSVGCSVELAPTPEAIQAWNAAEDAVIGLFHITC